MTNEQKAILNDPKAYALDQIMLQIETFKEIEKDEHTLKILNILQDVKLAAIDNFEFENYTY